MESLTLGRTIEKSPLPSVVRVTQGSFCSFHQMCIIGADGAKANCTKISFHIWLKSGALNEIKCLVCLATGYSDFRDDHIHFTVLINKSLCMYCTWTDEEPFQTNWIKRRK